MNQGGKTPGRNLLTVLVFLALLLGGSGVAADETLDIEYAEIQPLATKSVLLDIVKAPGGRLIAVGERGHVVLSDDGESWRQAKVVPTRSTLTSVVASGNRLWAAGHDSVIITSGDGGDTWSRQHFDPERQQPIMDIRFFDDHSGAVIGAYGLYMTTDDGGEAWEDAYVDEDNEYHLNDMVTLDGDRQIIAGEAGYSYRSFDGGESWESLVLPYQGSMWGGQVFGDGCILFFGLRGHVQETCDFGDTWTELVSGTQSSLSGATVVNDTILLVGNGGTLLTRRDRGGFEVHTHSSGGELSAAVPLDDGRFVLVGEEGVHYFPETAADENGENVSGGSGP
jgi:photosystem II stability/assembly factor-like uncharacterized protein